MSCLHELVEAQAARIPEAIAVAGGGRRLTYGELDERADRLALHLQALGVGPEVRVGVCLERSPELVVAQLGVLKAGGAYLPLDPGYPAERLAYILADSAVSVLITNRALAGALPAGSPRVLAIDGDWDLGERDSAERPRVPVLPENLAYVIYTSGSTGRPKGTGLAHAGLPNMISWHQQEYGLSPADRTTLLASPAFDASVWETWPPLATGASLHVPPQEVVSSPADLLAWLAAERITVCFLPTPLAEACLELELPPDLSLRVLMTAGDRLHRVARDLPFRLFNLYGPTESTVATTGGLVETGPESEATPPIGRPIAGFRVHLLDSDLRPVPAGEPGEIAIAGAGLARGYLGRPELTAERFIPSPWVDAPGARLYRTGDLGRLRPSGDLDFVGRIDHQVKIRGFRIELGEIEAVLRDCPQVRQAVVVASPAATGAPHLIAYVVPAAPGEAGPPATAEIRRRLQAFLPEPMVPAVYVFLEALPLSPNGKVDRKALPAPESLQEEAEREPAPPRTAAEEALAGIWRELLGVKRIGVGDHFLELGGHSLLATHVCARVRHRLGVELPLRDFFENLTLGALAARIEALAGVAEPASPIVPVPRTGDLPLSFAQERVWFLQQLDPTIRSYQAQAKIRFRGRLHVAALRRSLAEIVRRHEIFRTTFPTLRNRPVQRFHPPLDVPLPVVDLSGLPAGAREAETERAIEAECRRPFDVTRLPLVRWTLLRIGPEEHVWLHVEHHLVHDGWSFNRVVEELSALYAAFSRGEPSPLPELPLQFADWAVWQREWMRGPQAAAQIEYWKTTLSGRPAVIELPTDRPRPRRQSFVGKVERVEVPAPLCEALRAASRREGVSLFMLTQAAFATLLCRYSGQDQVNVGSSVANRRWRETESIVGMIVDNFVLANDLSGDPTVRQLLQRTRRLCLEAGAHQDIPFDLVVEAVQPERDLAYNPLFQASFNFHDSPLSELVFPGLEAELTEGLSNGSAKFDVNVICIPRSEQRAGRGGTAAAGIALLWEYATALFDRSTAERMMGHFQALLAGFAADSGRRRLSDLPLLTAAQRQQLLCEWNDTWSDAPRERTVHELFAAQARSRPQAAAVVSAGESLSYADLNARANRLAHHLRGLGVGPEVPVGVCLNRSLEAVVAILGILKAGGAYVPLEPAYPRERLDFMLLDSAVPVIVTVSRHLAALPDLSGREVIVLDRDRERIDGRSAADPESGAGPDNLAYILYTSGSTGRPKGVAVPHRGVVRLVQQTDYAELSAEETWLQFVPIAFDVSTLEIWGSLLNGGRLVVFPDYTPSLEELGKVIEREGVTSLWLTSGLFQHMVEGPLESLRGLRQLLAGGDVLSVPHVEKVLGRFEGLTLVNGYGPTENTTFTCCHRMRGPRRFTDSVPIGRPIPGTRVVLLDAHLQPVPLGVAGELYTGGDGLARGYLNRPELTAERFVPDPTGSEPGARLYRTGDLARHLVDGSIEFLGRIDRQVKIRGFRVELAEIEAALGAHPGVREAVVMAREDVPGEKRLVAYAVLKEDSLPEELLAFLTERLPAHMVPFAIVTLESLPLTANGKVDLAALPEPGPAAGDGADWKEPRTEIERLLQGIWSDLTGVERVGIRDDFFKLGGHSLLGVRMLSRLRDELDVNLPLSAVFERPTIEALAVAVEDLFLAEAEGLSPAGGGDLSSTPREHP